MVRENRSDEIREMTKERIRERKGGSEEKNKVTGKSKM